MGVTTLCENNVNPAQVFEVEINFIADNIQRKVKELKTDEEKIALIFKFLDLVNQDQGEFFHQMYDGFDKIVKVGPLQIRLMNKEAQKAFIQDIEENGFYLVRPPHKPILYGEIKHIYEEFPWIKPYPLYINLFGIRKRRILKDGIVGSKYIIVLKQNSNKNFSARSTYRVNRSNLPTKDIAKKTNRSAYARTAVRLSEIYNLLASVTGTDIAEWNIFTRSSALGRKSLERIIAADGNPLEIKKLKVKDNYINTNADILNAKLKGIGLQINFFTEASVDPDVYSDSATELAINGYTIMAPYGDYDKYKKLFDTFDSHMRECAVIESYPGQKQDLAWKSTFEDDEIKALDISDEAKDMIRAATMTARNALDEVKSRAKASQPVDDMSISDGPIRRRRGRKRKEDAVENAENGGDNDG